MIPCDRFSVSPAFINFAFASTKSADAFSIFFCNSDRLFSCSCFSARNRLIAVVCLSSVLESFSPIFHHHESRDMPCFHHPVPSSINPWICSFLPFNCLCKSSMVLSSFLTERASPPPPLPEAGLDDNSLIRSS